VTLFLERGVTSIASAERQHVGFATKKPQLRDTRRGPEKCWMLYILGKDYLALVSAACERIGQNHALPDKLRGHVWAEYVD
jgi:hypothetical protein